MARSLILSLTLLLPALPPLEKTTSYGYGGPRRGHATESSFVELSKKAWSLGLLIARSRLATSLILRRAHSNPCRHALHGWLSLQTGRFLLFPSHGIWN